MAGDGDHDLVSQATPFNLKQPLNKPAVDPVVPSILLINTGLEAEGGARAPRAPPPKYAPGSDTSSDTSTK